MRGAVSVEALACGISAKSLGSCQLQPTTIMVEKWVVRSGQKEERNEVIKHGRFGGSRKKLQRTASRADLTCSFPSSAHTYLSDCLHVQSFQLFSASPLLLLFTNFSIDCRTYLSTSTALRICPLVAVHSIRSDAKASGWQIAPIDIPRPSLHPVHPSLFNS